MSDIILVRPNKDSNGNCRLDVILPELLENKSIHIIRTAEDMEQFDFKNQTILFAVPLGEDGFNLELYRMLALIRKARDMFHGSVAGVLIDAATELYSKSVAREIVLAANLSGCAFPGNPLVEGTKSLYNFRIAAKNQGVDLETAYRFAARQLLVRITEFSFPKRERPNVLVIHAGSHSVSNTLQLWDMIRPGLADCEVKEISLQNGEISDCLGCPYDMCMHFSKRGKCFYGGVIVEEAYPAVERCDALVLICPNYNDALSANLAAFINRLTSLYRKMQFYDKYLFGVVVSGYSGSDILAKQLISALNMNKTFLLPPNFVMMETANDPGSILEMEGIHERAEGFSRQIRTLLLQQSDQDHLGFFY